MSESATVQKRHTNIAIVQAVIDEKRYRFSMTRSGVVVRQWHSRKTTTLTFAELIRATATQRQLL